MVKKSLTNLIKLSFFDEGRVELGIFQLLIFSWKNHFLPSPLLILFDAESEKAFKHK